MESTELVPAEENSQDGHFEIVIESKAKHGILWDLVQEFGSAAALAKELGCSPSAVGTWLNLRTIPKSCKTRRKRMDRIYAKLVELTGKPIEEIFPGFIRERLKDIPRVCTRRITASEERLLAMERQGEFERRMTLPSPEKVAMQDELKEKINGLLRYIPERHRKVLILRFGLQGNRPHTLKEVGHLLGIRHPERVRQMEARALRQLQNPVHRNQLVSFVDQHHVQKENNDEEEGNSEET